jgi:hypothetical protein
MKKQKIEEILVHNYLNAFGPTNYRHFKRESILKEVSEIISNTLCTFLKLIKLFNLFTK